MKYLSLFSGIGGFELGIQYAYEISNLGRTTSTSDTEDRRHLSMSNDSNGNGWRSDTDIPECIGFSEIDKYASQIYQKHFPTHKKYGDITRINADTLPDFDLLVGGFPCQSFSIAGKRRGFDDTRGTLFFDIARILQAKRPRLFLLENVKGLLSHDNGRTFRTIIATLDELGYDLQWQVLNSKDFGVPQNRERVFIVGHLRGTSRPEVFPITGQDNENTTISKSAKTAVARTLTGGGHSGGNHSGMTILAVDTRQMTREGTARFYDNVPTLNATMHKDMYSCTDGVQIRRLTTIECERLQGFPDNWTQGVSDTQRYKCLGNAVTVNVIQAIMERLL